MLLSNQTEAYLCNKCFIARNAAGLLKAPYYYKINEKEYLKYTPMRSAEDIECIIKHLREKSGYEMPVYLSAKIRINY